MYKLNINMGKGLNPSLVLIRLGQSDKYVLHCRKDGIYRKVNLDKKPSEEELAVFKRKFVKYCEMQEATN